jgi:hypothetical protein
LFDEVKPVQNAMQYAFGAEGFNRKELSLDIMDNETKNGFEEGDERGCVGGERRTERKKVTTSVQLQRLSKNARSIL